MEQLIILLLIGLVSLINWIIRKSAEAREQRKIEQMRDHGQEPPPPETLRPAKPSAEEGEGESMRRLMEALGLPQDSAPPPIPRTEKTFAPPPTPPPIPASVQREVRPPVVPAIRSFQPGAFAPKFPQASTRITPPTTAAATVKADEIPRIRKVLSAPGGVRDAIILSEVLGPPKALR